MKKKSERYRSRSPSSSKSSSESPHPQQVERRKKDARTSRNHRTGPQRSRDKDQQNNGHHQKWQHDDTTGSKGMRATNHRHRHRGSSSEGERNLGSPSKPPVKRRRHHPPPYDQPPPLPAFPPLPKGDEEPDLKHQSPPHQQQARRSPSEATAAAASPSPPRFSQRTLRHPPALPRPAPADPARSPRRSPGEDSPPQYSARENEFVVPLVSAVPPPLGGPALALPPRSSPPNLRSQFELPAFPQPSPSPLDLDLTPRPSLLMDRMERSPMDVNLNLLAPSPMHVFGYPLTPVAPKPFLYHPHLRPVGPWAAHSQPLLMADLQPPPVPREPPPSPRLMEQQPRVEEDPDYGLIDPSVPLPREDPYGTPRPPAPPPLPPRPPQPPPSAPPLTSPLQKVSPKSPVETMIDQETEELWESLEVIATPQKPGAARHSPLPAKGPPGTGAGPPAKVLKHGKDAFLEEVLPSITDTWNAEVMEEYRTALEEDLTPDNPQRKVIIASLTSIAKESKNHYREVMSAIITRLVEADARGKESLWYLIDSICRTVGGRYQSAFDQVLLKLVENQMPTPGGKLYERYAKLIDSWAKVFPEKVATARLLLQQQMPEPT